MYKAIKRLLKDRRGNALVIVGASIPLVVGAAGLATDTVQWVTWKRELQRAADSAAYAGVMGKAWGASTADASVTADLQKNQTTGITITSLTPSISYPPNTANYSGAVKVTLSVQKRLGFSSMFLSAAPTITASGTAALVDDGWYCVVALESGTDPGITIGGSANADLGCGAISDSIADAKSLSVDTNGNAYSFKATQIAGVGGLPANIIGTPASALQEHHLPMQDPFKDKYNTTIPGSTPCNSFNSHSTKTSNSPTTYSVTPGCFNDFKITGNATYNLAAGVYYLNSTDFDMSGTGSLIGTDVTIILTGATPGTVKTNGSATIQLTAPTTGDYANMLMIQSADAAVDNLNTINGNNSSLYDGVIYFPKGKTTFTGSSAAMTHCAMVVSKKVDFSGNNALQNDPTGCKNYKKVAGKALRLVA